MIRQVLEQLPNGNGKLREALVLLDDADRCRNLSAGLSICIFLGSAALSAFLSFQLMDFLIWLGADRIDPLIPVSSAYIALFVDWALLFGVALWLLNWAGFQSIQHIVQTRLEKLTLTRAELNSLRNAIATGRWRHGKIFNSVLSTLCLAGGDT